MKLTQDEIKDIAKLARLSLTPQEEKMYASQLSQVLQYMEMLNEVDTSAVAETTQVTGLQNVVREDEIIECEEDVKKRIIEQFPEKVGRLLKVKAVFGS